MGERPAECDGILLTRVSRTVVHQQLCPPLDMLAVSGAPPLHDPWGVSRAACVGPSMLNLCQRRLRAEGLCEPSCLAPALHGDVVVAGRNSKFLRGHSSHSFAGAMVPSLLQHMSLSPVAGFESHFHGSFPDPYFFLHTRVEANPQSLPRSLHLEPSPSSCTFPVCVCWVGESPAVSLGTPGKWAGRLHRLGLGFLSSKNIHVLVLFTPLSAAYLLIKV